MMQAAPLGELSDAQQERNMTTGLLGEAFVYYYLKKIYKV